MAFLRRAFAALRSFLVGQPALVAEAKPLIMSRTLWANLVAGLAVILARHHLPIPPQDQAMVVAGALAVMNILLRTITTQPVTLDPVPAAKAPIAMLLGGLLLGASVSACMPNTPLVTVQNAAAEALFAAQAGYAAALVTADAYAALPPCGAGAPALCRNPDVVKRMQAASHIVATDIATATALVADGKDAASAIKTVVGDVKALTGTLPAAVTPPSPLATESKA